MLTTTTTGQMAPPNPERTTLMPSEKEQKLGVFFFYFAVTIFSIFYRSNNIEHWKISFWVAINIDIDIDIDIDISSIDVSISTNNAGRKLRKRRVKVWRIDPSIDHSLSSIKLRKNNKTPEVKNRCLPASIGASKYPSIAAIDQMLWDLIWSDLIWSDLVWSLVWSLVWGLLCPPLPLWLLSLY